MPKTVERRAALPKAALVLDPPEVRRMIRERRERGIDRYDEVWDGLYVMAALANNEHQYLALNVAFALNGGIRVPDEGLIYAGCNVSDQEIKWETNHRCPDVAVFLKGNPAQDKGSHWFGGPDFLIEVVSPRDRSRDKFDFYFEVGVREVLILDRKPWQLELYRRDATAFRLAGTCGLKKPKALASQVIPFRFALADGTARPQVLVTRTADGVTTRI